MTLDLVLSPRIINPDGERSGSVAVADGRIVAVEPFDEPPAADRTVTPAADEVLLSGPVALLSGLSPTGGD